MRQKKPNTIRSPSGRRKSPIHSSTERRSCSQVYTRAKRSVGISQRRPASVAEKINRAGGIEPLSPGAMACPSRSYPRCCFICVFYGAFFAARFQSDIGASTTT